MTTDRGLVLRTYPFRESSSIVSLLGFEAPRVRLVAHGGRAARPRFAARLEPGNELDAIYSLPPGRDLGTLREATLRRAHLAGAARLDILATGWAALELIDRLVPEGAFEAGLASETTSLLSVLGRTSSRAESVLCFYAFELRFLARLGLRPQLSCCVGCNAPSGVTAGVVELETGTYRCAGCAAGPGPGRVAVPASAGRLFPRLDGEEWPAEQLETLARDRRVVGVCLHRLFTAHVERYRLPSALTLLQKVDATAATRPISEARTKIPTRA